MEGGEKGGWWDFGENHHARGTTGFLEKNPRAAKRSLKDATTKGKNQCKGS